MADREVLALLDDPDWPADPTKAARLREPMLRVAAFYFLQAKNRRGRPVDPVARFHLGNGARLERLNWLADTSAKAMRESHGLMVNYLYALDRVEQYHEAYSNDAVVAASSAVTALLEAPETRSGRRRDRR